MSNFLSKLQSTDQSIKQSKALKMLMEFTTQFCTCF